MTESLSAIDRDALERAFAAARSESVGEREHLDRILAQSGWRPAAESAAYHLQCSSLKLRPWQSPPCEGFDDTIDGSYGHTRAEVTLRRRMLAAGLSIFEPDPVSALQSKSATVA
jgi:hypothetical protein